MRTDRGTFIDRKGSTLGVMDDLQIAVHTYDGCSRGCPGCIVDKYFKNKVRGELIMPLTDLKIVHDRVLEYYGWCREVLNHQDSGYFGPHGYQVEHFSYTCRFGNHSELPGEVLAGLAGTLDAPFKVFSVAPFEALDELDKFVAARAATGGEYFLEIIYDPVADRAETIRDIVQAMRARGILGYPEILITQRLLAQFGGNPADPASVMAAAARFVDQALAPLHDVAGADGMGVQVQFGRYSPSKTRNFRTTQVVPLDVEVAWLAAVSRRIVQRELNIHPIPLGEYAVTFFDEYQEWDARDAEHGVNLELLPPPEPFHLQNVVEKTRDIYRTSLYVDHNLDLYVWSESMGQHVLDKNFGFPALGNLRERSMIDLVTDPKGPLERMARETARQLLTHPKCGPCRYKSFCASHAVPFFRTWHDDTPGEHCYGYLPVIREYQKSPTFLRNMVNGFRELGF